MKTLRLAFAGAVLAAAAAAHARQAAPPTNAAKPEIVVAGTAARTNAAATAAPVPARAIRFQFDGIPYSDVVERFAQMSGKALIASTNVTGSLTYDDPNSYNYNEALDTLNQMLATKGVALVEDGNNLRLVPFKELPSAPLRILRGTDNTGDARPGEVVTVVLDVANLDAKEVADSVAPMLSTAGSVVPLGRGRGLVITDRLSNIQRVRTLLSTIGTAQTADRQMKTYTLVHASGAIVSDLLNRTFGLATAPKRTQLNASTKALEVLPPDPNDYITSVYDDASRTLLLFGPPDRLALADELVNKFEQKEGGGGDVRIYYPQSIKAEELANLIRQAIPGVAAPNETAAAAATKARVIADAPQNRIIVAAPIPGQLEQIDQLVQRIDKGIQGANPHPIDGSVVPTRSQSILMTRIFRPRATDATNVAAIVRQALTRRGKDGQAGTTASIGFDAGSQSVVVTGTPADLQTASDIVSQLDTGTTQPVQLQTKFIDVGSTEEARRIQPLVEQLYKNQTSDGTSGTVAHAKIVPDLESGRLIVTASAEHVARIEDLVRQLRADQLQVQSRHLKVVALRNSRADTALPGIQSLLNERLTDRRFSSSPKPSIVADAPNNRLLVTATDEQIKELEAVVAVVDVAPAASGRELNVIPLQAKTAAEIIPLITQLAGQLGKPGQSAPSLLPDPTGKQLIVLADATDLERIRGLVKQFDVSAATAAPRQFRGVDLFSRTAAEFVPLVTQLYQEQLRGQPEPAGGAATLLAEPKANRIMVSGPDKEIARVETIVRQLDPAGKAGAHDETRVLRLRTASAADIVGLVDKSLNAQSQQVRVLVDARSNSLVLTGDHDSVDAAAKLVQQLDTRADSGPRELRILELKSGDATALAPMVNSLFADLLKDQRGADYVSPTRIVPDLTSNRLIVTGAREEIEQVAGIVNRLDNAPQQAPGARVFKLNTADASILAPIVAQAMVRYDARGQAIKRVTVTADDKSNALIVSGTRSDLQDAESVIEKLDGDTGGGSIARERILRIFEVKGDPEPLAAMVQKVFAAQNPGRNTNGLLSITPEAATHRLLVLAPPAVLAQVETVVQSLDATPDQIARELHPVEIKNSTATEILPRVTQIYSEQSVGRTQKPATLYADATGNRILVHGTADQAATIKQIADTLASQSRPARESRTFDLGRLSEVTRVMPIAQQLYKDRVSSNPELGAPDAQFVTDNKTGRLFVTARPDHLKILDELVAQLRVSNDPSQSPRETRSFDVGTASDVARILPIVQQLYTDRWKDRADTDPADAQIVPDSKGGRLIISGKAEHLKQIEAILSQLGTGKPHAQVRETRIIDLSTATAIELAPTVRTLYTEEAKGRLGPDTADTLITPDTGGNRLILVGDTNELAVVEGIVRKLDRTSAQSSSARVFKIKSADPDKVAEILTASLVRIDANGRVRPRATVSVDAKTRTLIVTGDPKELQGVSLIIEQLDQSLGDQPERHMKVHTLRQGKATVLVPRVRQIYTDRVKAQPELGTSELLMIDETESNQIILAGNDAQLKVAGQIIEELQSAQVSRAARETRMIDVGTVDELTRLQPLVQQLYTDRWKGRSDTDPADAQIISDPKNARFIVSARTNQLAEIASIIEQLRGQSTAGARETRIIELTTATASELSGTLRTLYTEQAKSRPGAPTTDTLILPDSGANRIIVTAATNELAIVEDLIRKLDKVGAQSSTARVFKIKSADPEKVAEILGSVLVRFDGLGRAQKRISVVTDPKTRTLIATGDAKELQSAAVIIEQLDSSLGTGADRTMRVLALKERRASDVVPKLRQVYTDQARNNPEFGTIEPLILEDSTSNQLIVAGNERQLVALEEIAVILQKSGDNTGRATKVFALERSSASSLVAMLAQVFPRQIASTEPTDRLVASPGGNDRSLVVEAPASLIPRIEELVTGLDKPGPEGPNVVQTVKLNKSRAQDIADALNRTLTNRAGPFPGRRLNVSAVIGANSLIISGTTNAVQDVMKMVRDLDQEGGGSGEIEVRVYKLENGTAKEVSAILDQLLRAVTRSLAADAAGSESRHTPDASISIDDRSNRLIISATAAHFRVVEKILPTLDKAPDRADRDVQFVWLRKAKAYDVANRLEALFEDRPRGDRPVIEADPTSNSLTIIARKGDLVQIQDLVARFDQPAGNDAIQVRLRPLDRVTADQMAEMLRNIYPQVSGTPLRVADKVPLAPPRTNTVSSAVATTNAAPAEIVIAIDKPANALVLSGPAADLDQVDRLITELSSNFYGNESEFRLFAIKDADPLIVARTLTELLKQDAAVIQQIPGQPISPALLSAASQRQRITVVAEPRTRSVIVRARPTDFALMESLIQQLDKAGETAQLEFRVVPLKHAQPAKVLPLVQQMVTQLAATRPGDPISVAVDGRSHGLVVIGRGTLATQIEKMIEGLDKPSESAEAEVRIVSLKKANATQLATVLQAMLRPGAQGEATPEAHELQEQVRRLRIQGDRGEPVELDLAKPIKISPDPAGGTGGGNRLVITSSPENIRALVAVVDLMDSVPVLEGVSIRFHRLEHADAAAVAQVITTVFTQGKQFAAGPGGPGGEPAREGRALVNPLTVSVDNRGNTLILSGQPDGIELALRIARDMDRELEGAVTDVRLFRLKHASATRLVPLLQSVFTEGPSVPGTEGLSTQVTRLRTLKDVQKSKENQTPKTRTALTIQADDQSNVLVVAARSDNLPLIADVIEQLDIPSASGLESVRVYPLEHSDPAAIQKVLTDLYTGPRSANIRAEDRPIITVDPRTSSLVVAGNSKAFAIIEALLKQLDQKLPFDLRDIAIVPLEHADASVVGPTLQKLMDARVTQRATLNQGQADTLKVVIIPDQRSNSLLVGGGREAFEMVQSLAKQLDNAGPALAGRVRLIPMKYADARVVAGTLGTLFEQRYAALRNAESTRNKPVILADSRSNSLLVAAGQDDNRTLDDLLTRLDAKQDNPALTLTVIPLKHNDSARVTTLVEGIFAARLRAQVLPGQAPLPSDQIKVEPDALNNALVVSASKENLELVQGLVAQLDQEPAVADGVFETFTLEFADASRVSTIIKSLVDQGLYRPGRLPGAAGKSATGQDVLSTSVDRRSNTLIVSASPENLAIVREVIRRIDTKDLAATADVRVYALQHARASSLATTLTQFFNAKRTADSIAVNANERSVPATVIPDDRVNTILVTGGKEAFDLVERLLPQLDGDGVFTRLNFRVFPLKRATAMKLQATLTPIFANRPPRVKGEPVDPITIVADQWVNALLVGATVEDMGSVAALIERLDSEPTDTGIAIHVFPLSKADARRVATTVQSLFRENLPNQIIPINVSADERINAIVVSCGETDAARIGELIRKLDTDQVAKVSEIRVFPLQFARAEALSTILNTSLNSRPVTSANDPSPNAQSVLQFITRTEGGQELVTAALKESILITPDSRMNSLIVSGPVDYMGLLEQIITRLDSSSPQQAKIKVFALKNGDARQMAEVLTQLFRMQPTAAVGGQRSIQYTLVRAAGDGTSPEEALASATVGTAEQAALTVTIDPRTNSLLVGGTDHYVGLVSQIIDTLDSSVAHERNSEVVRLKNSQATEVAAAIRLFLDQERQKMIQALGADAAQAAQRMFDQEVAVVAEQTSNTLLLSANRRYFDQIRAIIDELDQAQPQVLIQVLLAEVTLDNDTDLGVEWTYKGRSGNNTYGTGTDFGVANALSTLGGYNATVAGSDFNFLLRALKDQGRLEVLSRPQIVTADNKPATINIGQKVPLVDQSRLDAQNNLTTSFRYEDVGVNLTVTPKISPDGFVKMEIGTTNSSISSSAVQVNKASSVPIINQRKANTTVSAQSGQTIIIGGLIGTTDDIRVKKVPVLGDIPYLGALFRSTSTQRERKELLILLTPQVLLNPQTPVPLQDPDRVLRDQVNSSPTLRGLMKGGELQRRMLEPIYPTNAPIRVVPGKGSL